MGWSGYTTFAFISFIVGVGCLLFPQIAKGERAAAFFAGAGVFAWELFVAGQTSGIFPVSIPLMFIPAIIAVRAMLGMSTAEGDGQPNGAAGDLPATTTQRVAAGAGLLRDGAVIRALESYGRRELAGQPVWAPETQPLQPVREAMAASSGTLAASQFIGGLVTIAAAGPWHAIGVWRFVYQYGLPGWRYNQLPTMFLDALRQLLADPATPAVALRFNDFEADIVRRSEPHGNLLWSLVPIRTTDLEPQEPPAVGAEPPVADIAEGEQRLIARLGTNRLIVSRTNDGYVATLVRSGDQPGGARSEIFAQSGTLIGLLRETGQGLRASAAVATVSDDLAPYLPLRRPSWWPVPPEPFGPASWEPAPQAPPEAPVPAVTAPDAQVAYTPPPPGIPAQPVARSAADWDQLIGGVLRDVRVMRALEAFGRRQLAGEHPWSEEHAEPLGRLRDAIAAAGNTIYTSRLLDGLQRIAATDPWYAIGVWRFAAAFGPPAWRTSTLPATFLDALKRIVSDPATPAVQYRLDEVESELVRTSEPPDSPLRSLLANA